MTIYPPSWLLFVLRNLRVVSDVKPEKCYIFPDCTISKKAYWCGICFYVYFHQLTYLFFLTLIFNSRKSNNVSINSQLKKFTVIVIIVMRLHWLIDYTCMVTLNSWLNGSTASLQHYYCMFQYFAVSHYLLGSTEWSGHGCGVHRFRFESAKRWLFSDNRLTIIDPNIDCYAAGRTTGGLAWIYKLKKA